MGLELWEQLCSLYPTFKLDVPIAAGSKICLIIQPCTWEMRSTTLQLVAYTSVLSPWAGSPQGDSAWAQLWESVLVAVSNTMADSLAPYACKNIGFRASRRQWKPVEHLFVGLDFFFSFQFFFFPPQWQDTCKSCPFNQLLIIVHFRILVKLCTGRSVKFSIGKP